MLEITSSELPVSLIKNIGEVVMKQRYTNMWKELLEGFEHDGIGGFAVFSHGSAVFLKRQHDTEESAREEALEVMRRYGPVFPGSEAGDFSTILTKGRVSI